MTDTPEAVTKRPFVYPHDMDWTIMRDGVEHDVLVEYAVEEHGASASGMSGPPENYDPGSSWVFCINEQAFVSETKTLTLTEAEVDKIHDWLTENPPEDDGDYDDY